MNALEITKVLNWLTFLVSGSQQMAFPQGHWKCLEILWVVTTLEARAAGIWWGRETTDAAYHPKIHRTYFPHTQVKELSGPKYQ